MAEIASKGLQTLSEIPIELWPEKERLLRTMLKAGADCIPPTEEMLWRELGIRRGIAFDEKKWIPDAENQLPVEKDLAELRRMLNMLTAAKSDSVIEPEQGWLRKKFGALLSLVAGVKQK